MASTTTQLRDTNFCNSLTRYSRLITRVVSIGEVPMGGDEPIRIQSMTTTDTMDTRKTVEQSIRIIDAGADYVRITAPSIKEAKNLLNIKNELRKRGYGAPLIADIHFTPNAAEEAARIVEKVRVNPGNYADKKKFQVIEYSDIDYNAELERIRERFVPLIKVCKEYGTAMRIGTNHGSLSDRIMSRFGDTPLGMVESALEFVRICEAHNYYNIVLSMKASNPLVMVQAYRLLVVKMNEEGMNYPLHLGVTEAGDGEDGRIKSAMGIGTLLEDGIGDTIRVSLTEDPELEVPVAKKIAERYTKRATHYLIREISTPVKELNYNPFEYARRISREVANLGGKNVPRVISDFSALQEITPASLNAVGYSYSVPLDKWNMSEQASDFIFAGNNHVNFEIPGTLAVIYNASTWNIIQNNPSLREGGSKAERSYPLFRAEEYVSAKLKSDSLNFILVSINDLTDEFIYSIIGDKTSVLIFETTNEHAMAELRRMFLVLSEKDCNVPVLMKRSYDNSSTDTIRLYAATDCGALLLDGFSDGIWLTATEGCSTKILNQTAFGILQAARMRISKTEYISCPSCGRTLFDLQETTAKIRSVTDHLKGIKIGIMGCIVNGPGEMADADYGYVGTGPGKITLYKGKEVVRRNVPAEQAVEALIGLIEEHGDWVEKPASLY